MIRKEEIEALTKEQLLDGKVIGSLSPSAPDYNAIRNAIIERAVQLRCATDVRKLIVETERRLKAEEKRKQVAEQLKKMVGEDGTDCSRFLKFNGKGEIVGIDQNAVFEHLTSHVDIMVYNRKPYVYEGGVFKLDNDGIKAGTKIKSRIGKLIPPQYRTGDIIEKIYKRIVQEDSLIARKTNEHPSSWINFKNGFFDVKTGEWHEHDPKYHSLNQIPWEYDPETKCDGSLVEEFLDYALYRENAKELFLEYVGWAMTPNSNFQRFLMFTGQGGNGKSVLIKLFDRVIGADNLTHLSLSQISADKFSTARLLGKLANSCGDLKTESVKDCQKLKTVTGGDGLNGEYKGVDSFEFDSYAKLLFSVNEIPRIIGEDSDAVFRRMLVLTVDRKPQKEDVELNEKLAKQIPYFLKLCVDACRRLYERGSFIECPNSAENVMNARLDSNSVDSFIAEVCETGKKCEVSRPLLYEEYEKYCKEEGKIPKAKTQFFAILRNKGYTERKTDGKRLFVGIAIKPEGRWSIPAVGVTAPKFPEMPPVQQTMVQDGETGEVKVQGRSKDDIARQLSDLLKVSAEITRQIQALQEELAISTP